MKNKKHIPPHPSHGKIGQNELSSHILHSSAAMLGVCLTIISLVKVVEETTHIPSAVDKFTAINSLFFLFSTGFSYLSLRKGNTRHAAEYERWADGLFLFGLLFLAMGGILFAFEWI